MKDHGPMATAQECVNGAQDTLIAAEKALKEHYECLIALSGAVDNSKDAKIVGKARVSALEVMAFLDHHHLESLRLLERLDEEMANEATRRR